MELPRLTPHQAEVFARIARRARKGLPVTAEAIGCRGAVAHLTDKGYIVPGPSTYGPRGGERPTYRVAHAAQRRGLAIR